MNEATKKLYDAITKSDFAKFLVALQEGADINSIGEFSSRSPLMYAVSMNDFELVNFMLENREDLDLDVNLKDEEGWTAIWWAVNKASSLMFTHLFEHRKEFGIDVTVRDKADRTIISQAHTRSFFGTGVYSAGGRKIATYLKKYKDEIYDSR